MSAEHDDELWFVELPDGRTRCMSLEELDGAYQRGEIDEHVRVRKDGEAAWSTLAAIAGLDESVEVEAAPISVRPGQAPEAGTYSREEAFAETIRSNPLSAMSAGPNSLAPYAISADAPPSLPPTPTPGPLELDYDLDDPYAGMQKSSKGLVFGLVAAVAIALGVTGYTVSRAHGGADAVVQAMPAAAAQALPPPAKTEDPAPPPAPKLNDEQKKQLSALDNKHEAESNKKARERAEKAATQQVRRSRGKSSEPFVKGTSKYDPLNGAL
jgi:hypothetical protein